MPPHHDRRSDDEEIAEATAQLEATLNAIGTSDVLPSKEANEVARSQQPALARQLLLLRLIRAVVGPTGDSISEAQWVNALRPLRTHLPRRFAAAARHAVGSSEPALFRPSTLSAIWRRASNGRIHQLLEMLCPIPAARAENARGGAASAAPPSGSAALAVGGSGKAHTLHPSTSDRLARRLNEARRDEVASTLSAVAGPFGAGRHVGHDPSGHIRAPSRSELPSPYDLPPSPYDLPPSPYDLLPSPCARRYEELRPHAPSSIGSTQNTLALSTAIAGM
jgi:hypothetical protein